MWVDELAAMAAVTPMRAAMQQAMSRSVMAKIHAAITQAVAVTVEIFCTAAGDAAVNLGRVVLAELLPAPIANAFIWKTF